jgi:hypothetical protein
VDDYSVMIGYNAKSTRALNDESTEGTNIVIGKGTSTNSHLGIAIGLNNTISAKKKYDDRGNAIFTGKYGVIVGANSKISDADYGVGVGYNTFVSGENGIAIGYCAGAKAANTIVIGGKGDYTTPNLIQLGNTLSTKLGIGNNTIELGTYDTTSQKTSPMTFTELPKIKTGLLPSADNDIATKKYADDAAKTLLFDGGDVEKSIVVGHGASTVFNYSVVLGYFAKSLKNTDDVETVGANVIIGYGATSHTHCSVAVGLATQNLGPTKLAGGKPAYDSNGNKIVLGRDSVAIGNASSTSNNSAIAIGYAAVANGENSIAIGKSAQAFQENSTAIGNGAVNNVENSVVIGNGAVKSTTLGAITITTDGESTITFSVGTKSFTINLT